jgi:hypothetical protein
MPAHPIEPLFRIASAKLWRDHAGIIGLSDKEAAMCMRSEHDLYRRTSSQPMSSKPTRSLIKVLRDLFRPRRPRVAQAEVVPFPAEAAARTGQENDRDSPKAA